MGAVSGNHLSWMSLLGAHGVIAVIFWWLMPHGFPISHAHFWVNQVLPIAFLVGAIAVSWQARNGSVASVRLMVIGLGAAWIGGGIAARISFPMSMRGMFIPPLAWGVFVIVVGT